MKRAEELLTRARADARCGQPEGCRKLEIVPGRHPRFFGAQCHQGVLDAAFRDEDQEQMA